MDPWVWDPWMPPATSWGFLVPLGASWDLLGPPGTSGPDFLVSDYHGKILQEGFFDRKVEDLGQNLAQEPSGIRFLVQHEKMTSHTQLTFEKHRAGTRFRRFFMTQPRNTVQARGFSKVSCPRHGPQR